MERAMGFLMPLYMLAGIPLFLLLLAGYYQGMETWLGWGFWPSFGIMLVAFFFRDLGNIFIACVGFYGIWKGWGWAWWQALLVTAPGLVIIILMMLGGGIASVAARLSGRGA